LTARRSGRTVAGKSSETRWRGTGVGRVAVLMVACGTAALAMAGCGGGGGDGGNPGGGKTQLAAERLPIRDDFEGECTWPRDDDENAKLACEDGHYTVRFKSVENSIAHSVTRRTQTGYTSVSVRAKSTLLLRPQRDGFAFQGIACWTSARGEPAYGYAFLVGTLGDGTQGYLIAKHDESDERLRSRLYLNPLVEEESDSRSSLGSAVEIRGECQKEGDRVRLALFVDGARVASAEDTRGASAIRGFGAYGLLVLASRAGTEIRFDDFLAEELTD
jgi:hypothetical protein